MSILGKVFAILNVLAAGAFVYFAFADWSQRQLWSYACLRQDLALDGLPVDEDEKDADGTRLVDKLSDPTMTDLFKPVGGITTPLAPDEKTQAAEVKRVHKRLRAEIDAIEAAAKKRQKLKERLVPLATTGGERDELVKMIDTKEIDFLLGDEGPLEQEVKKALPVGDDIERKRKAIAHFLFNTTALGSTEYQRVVVVVGLRSFTAEVEHQAKALREMAHRVKELIDQDQYLYERQFVSGVSHLRLLGGELVTLQGKLEKYKELAKQHEELLRKREAYVKELRERLDQARQATAAVLAQLSNEQKLLFEAQQQVLDQTEKNQDLEREIRTLEKVDSEGN